MYKIIFNDIQSRLATLPEVKQVAWYLGQDNQKGGIINIPCVLVKFAPAVVTQIAKTREQVELRFELCIYTDFKKGNPKVGTQANLHFKVEEQIHTALAGYERTGITPMEREGGLLKSTVEFICRTTGCIPNPSINDTINAENIELKVDS